MTAPAPAGDRPTFRDGHLLVERLVARESLPEPTRRTVRVYPEGVALALRLADRDALRAWHAHLDTTDLEPHGPYRVGRDSAIVVVGRLRGVATVLEVAVEHDDTAAPYAAPKPDAGSPSAGVVPPAPSDASDVLVARSAAAQTGSRSAPGAIAARPAPDAETTGDHDFRDYLGPDGRPRPWPVDAIEDSASRERRWAP